MSQTLMKVGTDEVTENLFLMTFALTGNELLFYILYESSNELIKS